MRPAIATVFFVLVGLTFNSANASFLDEQLLYSRVRDAYKFKKDTIVSQLKEMNLITSNFQVLVKAYKYEERVRVFVKSKTEKKWRLYQDIQICSNSGTLGPKRMQGDMQVPEGYYTINHFNPYSNFHLSLGISYPNKSDRLKSTAKDKGGAIYMHGNCVTIGCIPITDEPIKEIYILCVMAKSAGQVNIPIHIFPFDYSEIKMQVAKEKYPEHIVFWENLFEAEKRFQEDSIQVPVSVNEKGDYFIGS